MHPKNASSISNSVSNSISINTIKAKYSDINGYLDKEII